MFVSAGVIFLIIFWIMMILASYAMLAMELVGLWKTFRKMGHPGWKGIIPFYGTYVLFRDLWKTKYFWLIVILSGASVAVMLLMYAVMAIVMVATRGENPEAVLIIISVLMLVLLAVDYYLYLRLRDNKPIIASLRIVKRLLPHQKAMKAIEAIKAEHMVTAEDPKEYYTRLTDTLRKYIEERYGFSAMEMTSSEIIDRLMQSGDQTMLDELRQLFQTADLVKFAKYSTLINENDANLVSAIDFINQTKLELPPEEVEQKPQLTAEEQRSQKSRRVLKASIAVFATVGAIIFCYVVVSLYQLLS